MPLYRRIPKRGFTNFARRDIAIMNVGDLERLDLGQMTEVSLETLKDAHLLKGRYDRLTILGTGELKKSLTVKAHKVSPSAQEKITKAGGKVELLPIPGKAKAGKASKATAKSS